MKATIRLLLALTMPAVLMLAVALAQSKPSPSKSDERTRGLFVSKKSDALRIVVSDARDRANPVPVDPKREFTQGDELKVFIWSNFQGYVYIVNIEPNGRKRLLIPDSQAPNNAVQPDRRYEFPPGNLTIQFDENKGIEVLQVITSPTRIAYLDQAMNNPDGYFGESAASAASELASDAKASPKAEQSGIVGEQTASVLPKEGPNAIRSRDIRLAAGRDKDPEGSVVAVSDDKGKNGKMKPGEAAVFEIRLKHN